jgi:dihydropteroate synthase
MLRQGATFIDIGAQSTRPGARTISASTEVKRLLPVIKSILDSHPDALLSVDTFYAETAARCVEAGAVMVNDVSGGNLDKQMFKTIASLQVPYILMHMKGTPATMQLKPVYRDVVAEVAEYLAQRVARLVKLGVKDIIVDPGFGFGKTTEHNYSLLRSLEALKVTGCPVLVGLSRKYMIYKSLNISPEKALNGTTALNMIALMNGASILRVHDVKEAVETVKLFNIMQANDK